VKSAKTNERGDSMEGPDIVFPNLGIEIETMNPVAFTIFGLDVYWYGIIIVTGIMAGLLTARVRAKRSGQDPEIYSDFLIYALISAIVGARLYYVAFSWDDYKDNLLEIFATRQGGLAIYGGVIAALIALLIYTRVKKLDFWVLADTAVPGLVVGQIIGRLGNFINMEAFGGPSKGMLAMALNAEKAKIPAQMLPYISELSGYSGNYLVVQPTFLYEQVWNVGVFIMLLIMTKYKKFNGELIALYLAGYGMGRAWIEGMRTDQLIIGDSGLAVSQLLSIALTVVCLSYVIYRHLAEVRKNKEN